MFIQRIRSEGISHLSYFIGQGAEAAVVDPRRDVDAYLDLAQKKEMQIKYIFETHRNEDYVIGSQELAAVTGARIFHGGQIFFKYGSEVKDGQEFNIGALRIKALHTPGHTAESFSYVLFDPPSTELPVMVFTGDALMVGEVGRTDFLGPEIRDKMASDLYDSIFQKLMPLGPGTMICPAHGAGSVCATEIREREDSTIGIEAASNPYLRMSKAEFVAAKKKENLEMSPIFKRMEVWNLEGPKVLHVLPRPSPLSPKDMKHAIVKGAFLLDVRQPYSFANAHIPGAINLQAGHLPGYAGYVVPPDRPLALVVECESQITDVVRSLVRLGYDNFAGYLRVGMDLWCKTGNEISWHQMMTVKELAGMLKRGEDLVLLDVRDRREMGSGTIDGAKHIHLGEVQAKLAEIPRNKLIVTYCGSGYRGGCAASILLRNGYNRVMNLHGGYSAWKSAVNASSR